MIHISFDLWNTLISSNSEFGEQRAAMISKELNIPVSTVNETYKSIKKFLDLQAEYNGISYSTTRNWCLLVGALTKNKNTYRVNEIAVKLETTCNRLFDKYKPTFSQELIDNIRDIKGYDVSIGIISNTNFISGNVIKETLFDNKGLFNVYTFSDLENVAKPSDVIFIRHYEAVSKRIFSSTNHHLSVYKSLHIGDNEICDGGSTELGIDFELVTSPSHTIEILQDVKNLLINTYKS